MVIIMTENYLVLDNTYYWYLEETQYESSARIRLHDLLMKEYRNVVLLKVRNLRRGYLSFDYIIYEKDKDGLEVIFPNR